MTHCSTCDLIRRRDANLAPLWDNIYRTQYWDVAHCNSTDLYGWLVLVARRHIAALDELTEDEAIEQGSLIRQLSIILKEFTGCLKTYVIQFAEHPDHQHVHFHIVPRMSDLPADQRGPGIFKHLGVPAEQRVSETAMNALALEIRRHLVQM